MKSALVINDFITDLPNNDFSKLTRGQACLVQFGTKAGTTVEDPCEFCSKGDSGKMVQFVVGLGDGKVKQGVWLNPSWMSVHKETYTAPVGKTHTFNNLSLSGIGYKGFDADVVISTKPFDMYGGYPLEVYTASVTMEGAEETAANVITRLKKEVEKVVAKINARFGADSITLTSFTEASAVFTGKAGFEYYVRFDGILKAEYVEGTENQTPVGTYEQVSALEKETAVANVGFNPNYAEFEKMYGDIFTAEKGKTYDTYVLTARADYTHPFNLHTEGLMVTQFIAIDSTATEAITRLETSITNLK